MLFVFIFKNFFFAFGVSLCVDFRAEEGLVWYCFVFFYFLLQFWFLAFVSFFLRQGEAFSATSLLYIFLCLFVWQFGVGLYFYFIFIMLGFIFIMLGFLSNNILLCKGSMLHAGRQQRRKSKKSSKSFCLLVRMKDFSLIS